MSDHSTLTADQDSALEARLTLFVVKHGRSPYPEELSAMTAALAGQTAAEESPEPDEDPPIEDESDDAPEPIEDEENDPDDPEARVRAGEIAREEILAEREAARILAVHRASAGHQRTNGGHSCLTR